MKKLLAAVLLAAVVGSAAGAFYLQSYQLGSDATPQRIIEEITKCTTDRYTPAALGNPTVQDCLIENVMRPQVEGGNLENLNLALLDVVEAHRDFWIPCHDMMHKAADRAAESPQQMFDILRQIDIPSCQGGVVHGLLDSLAKLNPTVDDFAGLGAACGDFIVRKNKNEDPVARERLSLLYGYCTDGAGHAAWSAFENLDDAVAACGKMEDANGRANCAEGLIMQYFEPANGVAKSTVENSFTELPEICANWPDYSEDRDTLVGCNSGAGYIYTRPAWWVSHNFDIEAGTTASKVVPADIMEKMKVALDRAIDACVASHSGDCLKSIARQIPPNTYRDEKTIRAVCARLGEFEEYCVADDVRRNTRI